MPPPAASAAAAAAGSGACQGRPRLDGVAVFEAVAAGARSGGRTEVSGFTVKLPQQLSSLCTSIAAGASGAA